MKNRKYCKIPISCRYDPQTLQELDKLAMRTNQTVSDILRMDVRELFCFEVVQPYGGWYNFLQWKSSGSCGTGFKWISFARCCLFRYPVHNDKIWQNKTILDAGYDVFGDTFLSFDSRRLEKHTSTLNISNS